MPVQSSDKVANPGEGRIDMEKMRANVFHGKDKIRVEEVERPRAGVAEAVIRVTLTTICERTSILCAANIPLNRDW
jgi:hypothetical protein